MNMKRILIVYATSHGHTRAIAEALATRLRSGRHIVELADAGANPVPPIGYNIVILGSRVEFGRHAPSSIGYIETHRALLQALPTAFFSVNNAAATAHDVDPLGYLERLFTTTKWRPRHAIAFVGALPYREYGWMLRIVMKQIAKRAGTPTDTSHNHVLTQWDSADRFADEVADDFITQQREPVQIHPARAM